MPLRIGFDMDGVLADFASAFHEVEARLFGSGATLDEGRPEEVLPVQTPAAAPAQRKPRKSSARSSQARRESIWRTIESTPDFWATLKPIDDDAVRRIHALMLRHKWEVFFITQRPKTDGDTVQRQTQKWLVEQGFDLPSVLVLGGSRGAAAGSLRLDYHVDDSAQNCIDVISDSRAKPILIVPDNDGTTIASARKLGIGTADSIGACLEILETASTAQMQPGLLARLATFVGWK